MIECYKTTWLNLNVVSFFEESYNLFKRNDSNIHINHVHAIIIKKVDVTPNVHIDHMKHWSYWVKWCRIVLSL